ncbi:MAG: hypothetical protein CL484_03030 [Acidobacteria bacterium]|nr:hypothetical protein [Acidobacteriota bacterium]
MPTLDTKWPTLLDVANATDPDGNIATVVEILAETNEILLDMVWIEGNLATGHMTSIRTGLPSATWRAYYGGVQPTKSTRAKITDSCGMLEAYAEIDKAEADLNGNTQAFRLQEDSAHLEGMSQQAAQALFTANDSINPEQFMGFAPRFNDLGAGNKDNILDAGGTGSDNGSIWLVGWGPMAAHGIYPKGSTGGVQMNDKGQVTIENVDGLGGRMEAYRTHYRWDMGLTVRDWRYVVRIANIDRSELNADASGASANLPELMFDARERLPNTGNVKLCYYMDRTLRAMLRKQLAKAVTNSTLTVEQVGGVDVQSIDTIPMRRVDALEVNEARVV